LLNLIAVCVQGACKAAADTSADIITEGPSVVGLPVSFSSAGWRKVGEVEEPLRQS
jgi:hypothetical protein